MYFGSKSVLFLVVCFVTFLDLAKNGAPHESTANRTQIKGRAPEQITEKTEFIIGSFETRFENVLQDMGEKFSKLVEQSEQSNENTTENDEDTSQWEKQKEAMLSKYGIDSDYRETDGSSPPPSTKPASPTEAHKKPTSQPSLQDSIEHHDSADIDALKTELNEKLREAEIELSIGRAKISQQQAEIASRQVDLERRSEALESKLAACPDGPARKTGFLDRLTRHLRRD